MKTRPLIYVAGPYSSNPVHGTRAAIMAGTELEVAFDVGIVIPHLSLLWDIVCPAPVETWYVRDFDLLERCDALVRLTGKSTGADNEVNYARRCCIPVFTVSAERPIPVSTQLAQDDERRFAKWREGWVPE
jgi:hypothetical protein